MYCLDRCMDHTKVHLLMQSVSKTGLLGTSVNLQVVYNGNGHPCLFFFSLVLKSILLMKADTLFNLND